MFIVTLNTTGRNWKQLVNGWRKYGIYWQWDMIQTYKYIILFSSAATGIQLDVIKWIQGKYMIILICGIWNHRYLKKNQRNYINWKNHLRLPEDKKRVLRQIWERLPDHHHSSSLSIEDLGLYSTNGWRSDFLIFKIMS